MRVLSEVVQGKAIRISEDAPLTHREPILIVNGKSSQVRLNRTMVRVYTKQKHLLNDVGCIPIAYVRP